MAEKIKYRVYGRRLTNDKNLYEGNGRFMPLNARYGVLVTRLDKATEWDDEESAQLMAKKYSDKNMIYEFEVRKVFEDGNTMRLNRPVKKSVRRKRSEQNG